MSHNFQKFHYLLFVCLMTAITNIAEAGSVQFSTYYPAPFGMYDRLRLVPRASLAGPPCDAGTFYYETGVGLRICDESATWGPLGGDVWTQDVNDYIYPSDTATNPNLNVGIGTSNPATKLHVNDPAGPELRVQGGNVDANSPSLTLREAGGGGFKFKYFVSGNRLDITGGNAGSIDTDQIMTLDRVTHNVGIGTAAPGAKLHIRGANDTAEVAAFMPGTDTGAPGTPSLNVGIGTTNPKGSLHILDKTGIPSGPVVGLLIERDSTFNGAPRMVLIDTALGAVTTAPSWNIDNTLDKLRIFRQLNIATAGPPCLTISNALNVGIGTDTPEFKLSLENDGGILSKGIYGSGAALATSGAGTRLIWYPRKAAFRMGQVNGAQWNDANIGDYSVAMGSNNLVSGTGSVALGTDNTVNGVGSFGLGRVLSIDGDYSAAIGKNITLPAAADYSFALGYEITATNPIGFGIGAYLRSGAVGAAVLGNGLDSANPLVNNTASSLAIGFSSNIPTLFIGPSSGVGTTGNVGIGTTTPGTNKLEVVGGPIKATGGFILETRTTNPGAPVAGQMWLCTDTGDATPCNGI